MLKFHKIYFAIYSPTGGHQLLEVERDSKWSGELLLWMSYLVMYCHVTTYSPFKVILRNNFHPCFDGVTRMPATALSWLTDWIPR